MDGWMMDCSVVYIQFSAWQIFFSKWWISRHHSSETGHIRRRMLFSCATIIKNNNLLRSLHHKKVCSLWDVCGANEAHQCNILTHYHNNVIKGPSAREKIFWTSCFFPLTKMSLHHLSLYSSRRAVINKSENDLLLSNCFFSPFQLIT